MGRNSSLVVLVGLGLALASCGGSSKALPGTEKDACTPGERTCDGLAVKVCEDDGQTQTVDETCLPPQTCSDGECSPGDDPEQYCVPDREVCDDGVVYVCDSTGSGSKASETCGPSQYCFEDDGSASCKDVVCKPDSPVCDGELATKCKPDGSGPLPGGKSCRDADQTCFEGLCHDFTCEPGAKLCQDGDVYLCAANGTSSSLLVECNAGQVCDSVATACRTKVCDPGKVSCNGSVIVACNDSGSEWLPPSQDCAATGEVCSSGVCREQTCAPYSQFCKDGNVYSCDGLGVGSNISKTCPASYSHCQESPGNAYCAENSCVAGQLTCDGNVLKTCTEDGNLPATGTDCGTDKHCDQATSTCVVKICEAGTTSCKDGDIYYCPDFINPYLQEECLSGTSCKIAADFASCAPMLCEPGETGCIANAVGVCAADGQSLSSTTENCATTSTVCTAAGACAATAVDVLGIAEDAATFGGGNVIGDALEVHSARKVTAIEANLVLASARELRWVIYEQAGASWIARVDKVVPNQTGTGYISSGALSYTLKAGKRYLFAVAVTGGSFIPYYDTAPFQLGASFGSVLGSLNYTYSANLPAEYVYGDTLYQMRITTVLP